MANHIATVVRLLVLLTLTACASTGNVPQRKDAIENLRSVRVEVRQDKDFSVKKSRNQMSPVGPMFGLIGMGIEAAARSASDSSLAETYSASLKNFVAKDVLKRYLLTQLSQAKRAASSEDADAILTVEIDEWGLRPCLSGQNDERMQVVVKAEWTLGSLPDKSTLWSKLVTHLEQDCHSLEKFRDESGLLTDSLSQSMEGLADKVVNEVLYP